MDNRDLIQTLGYGPDERYPGMWIKRCFDGRIMAAIPDDGLGNYPVEFLKALLTQKEEEGRFCIIGED